MKQPWLCRISQELLDVPHLHLILTIAKEMRPYFDRDPFAKSFDPLTWRQRFKASFGQDPLACPDCQTIMELVEIWEPERRYIWMKRWLETHRRRRAARELLKRLQAIRTQKAQQLAFDFL